MRIQKMWLLGALSLSLGLPGLAQGAFPKTAVKKCGGDAVLAGTVCLDKYEASVWRIPNPTTSNARLVKRLKKGVVDAAELAAAGATQLGLGSDDYAPCSDDGQTCNDDIFAASIAGVVPSGTITWFQAQEACANTGKRLPTSAEWQVGVNGSPDPGGDNGTTDCNTASAGAPVASGSRSACVSSRGAFDMVGNLIEWTADWMPASTSCAGWGAASDDFMCVSGASDTFNNPGAVLRGGAYDNGTSGGPLAIVAIFGPGVASPNAGFRCAR